MNHGLLCRNGQRTAYSMPQERRFGTGRDEVQQPLASTACCSDSRDLVMLSAYHIVRELTQRSLLKMWSSEQGKGKAPGTDLAGQNR